MAEERENYKRIAKNTLALTLRMFFTMAVGVYSSRVLLKNLGVVDYGVYNVVGGLVGMFGVLNASLSSGTQRFLNYYLGKKDFNKVVSVFNSSLVIYFCFAALILLLGETVGVYMLNYTLDIPTDRIAAANWVLQFTFLALCLNIVSTPYNSLIIAEEKITTFAYVAVVNSICLLMFALAIPYMPFDSIIVYSLLVTLLQLSMIAFYIKYCKQKFYYLSFFIVKDRVLYRKLLGFSGWSTIGVFAYMSYTQGLTLLLNIFFGPVINAAQAVAQQVFASLSTFYMNIITAAKPQMTKYYAEGATEEMKSLLFLTSKMSYGVMIIICMPFLINADYVFKIWLHDVPPHSANFLVLLLLVSIIQSLTNPVSTAIQATGNIRNFQIAESLVMFSVLPISYVALTVYERPELVYVVLFAVLLMVKGIHMYYLYNQLNISWREYLVDIMVRMCITFVVSYAICRYVALALPESFFLFVAVSVFSCLCSLLCFIILGLNPVEGTQTLKYVKGFVFKIVKK